MHLLAEFMLFYGILLKSTLIAQLSAKAGKYMENSLTFTAQLYGFLNDHFLCQAFTKAGKQGEYMV